MRHYSNTLKSLVFVTVALFSSLSVAESGLYIGGSLGNSQLGFETADSGSLDLSGSDVGYKIFTGFKFTMLAVEAGYVDFGSIKGDNDYSGGVSGFNAFGMLSVGVGPVELYGKAGGFVWETNYKQAQTSFKENGFDPAFGLGAMITLSDLSLRAEYEHYSIDGFDEVSMLSVGINFWLM